MASAKRTCSLCNMVAELRPYGPRGAMICFQCAMAPERKAETERAFLAQLDACGPVAVIDGSEVGPYPLKRGNQ